MPRGRSQRGLRAVVDQFRATTVGGRVAADVRGPELRLDGGRYYRGIVAAEVTRSKKRRTFYLSAVVLVAELRDQRTPGDVETATADCGDFDNSPWPAPDGGCGASFLACLGCPNARVRPGHHARLAHLHGA